MITNVKRLIDILVSNFTDPNENVCVPTEAQFNTCLTIFLENPEMWNKNFHVEEGQLVPN